MNNEKIALFQKILDKSNNIVFFGGAGVSTDSGIPDFRSKDGLYNTPNIGFEEYEPEYLLSKQCLYHNPKVFYEFYRQKLDVRNIEPNSVHYKLAELEKHANLWIVTQNIDGLHQKAGSKNVLEIHGTTQKTYCTRCGMEYNSDYIFNCKKDIPLCECGGMLRPDITLYGEQLPKSATEKAIEVISKADCLIIAGTSLQVYPANEFINYFEGNNLVIINKEPLNITIDEDKDLVIIDSLSNVFDKIIV